jgi:predicted ATPase/DNA-binding winged helix-turn-helix (wHTH) protein
MLSFPPFRLDLDAEQLWKNEEELHLRRKPFAILRYLVRNPHRLVSHAEVVEAVWGKIVMSESLLRTHVRDLRRVLGEGIIETVLGRGYRFTAKLSESHRECATTSEEPCPGWLVGRTDRLVSLRAALRAVREHRRMTVFVSGEPGVGKTTLVDHFLEQAKHQAPLLVGRGACVERYGSGQAYLPLLEAVGALCRGREGDVATEVMARHAPTWLAQMPGLVRGDRLEELQRRAAGATEARMSREFAEALEALSVHAPVVLVLEDMHWTDPFTAELLALVSKRREPARLMALATYRPSEVSRGHPLSRVVGELVAHKQASSLALEGFEEEELEAYLEHRFPGHGLPSEFAQILLESTGGNPLFVTTLADDLQGQGLISQCDDVWQLTASVDEVASLRPDGVVRLIDTQVDRLAAAEQRIIEAASVAGMTFTAELVAHALEADPDEVDSRCETLALERRLLRYLGTETWPDGTVHSRYAFGHGLIRLAALERTSSAKVRQWNRRFAERLEKGYPSREPKLGGNSTGPFDVAQANPIAT